MVRFRLSNLPVIPYDYRGSWFYFFSNESVKIIPYGASNIDIKNFSSGCYIFRCFDFYSWRSILSNGSEEITAWKHGDALHLLSFFIAKMSIYLLLFLFGRLWVRDLKENRNLLYPRSFDIFRVPTGSRNHILWSSKINMCIFYDFKRISCYNASWLSVVNISGLSKQEINDHTCKIITNTLTYRNFNWNIS